MIATILLAMAATEVPEVKIEPGTPIVAIEVVRLDVFDLTEPRTASWPYRTANRLNVLTREEFIRAQLLFSVGDPLDYTQLAETERKLRGTGFLDPVRVTARPGDGGAVVVVKTQDTWTTEVNFKFGSFGGRSRSGISLSEQNLFGRGKEVELEYHTDPERSSTTLRYNDPLFFTTRWRMAAAYSNASDGTISALAFEYPFFALDSPLAGGISWERNSLRQWLWADGEKAVVGDSTGRMLRLWGGVRLAGPTDRVDRVLVGVFREEFSYENWEFIDGRLFPEPDGRTEVGFELGWERQRDRWEVVDGFRAWKRQEDVPLGPNWRVVVGAALDGWGSDRERFRLHGERWQGWLAGRQLTWLSTVVRGRFESGRTTGTVTTLEAGTARTGTGGWRTRLAADFGHRLDRNEQLTLGADTGLRGWSPDTFDGTSRVVANAEWHRPITGELLGLGVIGVAVFADAGKTWGARVGRSTDGWRAAAGVGAHVELTRASVVRVIRVEAAWPDTGGGPTFLIVSGSLF